MAQGEKGNTQPAGDDDHPAVICRKENMQAPGPKELDRGQVKRIQCPDRDRKWIDCARQRKG